MEHSIFLGNLAWDVTRELVMDMVNDVLGPGLFNQGNLLLSPHLPIPFAPRYITSRRRPEHRTPPPFTFQLNLISSTRPSTCYAVRLAIDRETGRPRGFGHIDFKGSSVSYFKKQYSLQCLIQFRNTLTVHTNHFDAAILQTLRVLIAP